MLYTIPPSTKQYEFSYQELKEFHKIYCELADERFINA